MVLFSIWVAVYLTCVVITISAGSNNTLDYILFTVIAGTALVLILINKISGDRHE